MVGMEFIVAQIMHRYIAFFHLLKDGSSRFLQVFYYFFIIFRHMIHRYIDFI